jgi:hypothetical protein
VATSPRHVKKLLADNPVRSQNPSTSIIEHNSMTPVAGEGRGDYQFIPVLGKVPLENDPIFVSNDKFNKVKNLINQKMSLMHESIFIQEMDIVHKKIDEKSREVKEEILSVLNEFKSDME